MNGIRNLTTIDRTRQILNDLEAVRENLLALSDDIWLNIDHNDNDALEEGVQFKKAYNNKMSAFDALASELSVMVQRFTSIRLDEQEQSGVEDLSHNQRIIAELNREDPHSIDEDFRFKRPHGFILDGQATVGLTTWRRVYELICQQLCRRDQELFQSLPEHPDLISNRGNPSFARNPEHLRSASLIGDGVYAEVNLSANHIRDAIRRLLTIFNIPVEKLQLYLREDRGASQGVHHAMEASESLS